MSYCYKKLCLIVIRFEMYNCYLAIKCCRHTPDPTWVLYFVTGPCSSLPLFCIFPLQFWLFSTVRCHHIAYIQKKIVFNDEDSQLTTTLNFLIYKVYSIWLKGIFAIRFLKQHVLVTRRTVTFKIWRQDVVITSNINTQSLYRPDSFMFFIIQLESALYHLISYLFTFVNHKL